MSVTKTQVSNFKTRLHILYLGIFCGAVLGAMSAHEHNKIAIPEPALPIYTEHLQYRLKRLTGLQQYQSFINHGPALALAARQADLPRPLRELVEPAADRVLLAGPGLGALIGAGLAAGLGLLFSNQKGLKNA